MLGCRCCIDRNWQQLARRVQPLGLGVALQELQGLAGALDREDRARHIEQTAAGRHGLPQGIQNLGL
ncbi:hypothetical protein G6F22_016655 [Rhizopus arrhizus]|nr:hypothetical protein G6F22_016655 [Rhizopus arrhizus]KAG1374612.1 hypothetical protein G6F59_018394 [Rhizopus arrhizus]